MKILVIRGGGVGDFILILPLLKALRLKYPQAEIQILGHKNITRLAVESGLADSLLSLDSQEVAQLFQSNRLETKAPLLKTISKTDLLITFIGTEDSVLQMNLQKLASRVISIPPPGQAGLHASDHFLRQAGLQSDFKETTLRINLSPKVQNRADQILQELFPGTVRIIAFHPGSGSPDKNWPVSRFAETARLLSLGDYQPLMIEGEADRGLVDQIEISTGQRFPRITDLSLPLLAGILKRCHAYLGNDSGISHLAGACGIPLLVLFGPTDPTIWRPLSDLTCVLSFQEATVEKVISSLKQLALSREKST